MSSGLPIEVSGLSKHFGAVTAVSDLSFTVEPGRVTGFLGPNGAGKTTTLRMLLGLVTPSSGTARFGGSTYAHLASPLRTVGAVLETTFHPNRSGRNHLKVYARAAGIESSRVEEVLGIVDMSAHAHRSVGGYPLGMRQRLGLALALLGDPGVLILDEPVNGLDPEGIKWIRSFLRDMADQNRTVLISSHLLSELQQSVDDVVIISKGRMVHWGSLSSLDTGKVERVIVDSPDRPALEKALQAANLTFDRMRGGFLVSNVTPQEVGRIATEAGVEISSLYRQETRLEDSFLALVEGAESQ
jgi:ABC-2 type transport system ATP-binding protein